MNAFVQQDFKSQASFADSKTRLKMQSIFLRKELGNLKDARQLIHDNIEREKQEMRSFGNTIYQREDSSFTPIPRMAETSSDTYVSQVLNPHRIFKSSSGQIIFPAKLTKQFPLTPVIERGSFGMGKHAMPVLKAS